MFNNSNNALVIYSLDALSNALFTLMQKYRLDDISISQICEEANISRNTFYRNCDSKMDLVDYMIHKKITILSEKTNFDETNASLLYTNFFEFWIQEKFFLTILESQKIFSRFNEQYSNYFFQNATYAFLDEFLENHKNIDKLKLYHTSFLIGGLCNVLEYWTKEDFQTPIRELVITLSTLSPK